MTSEELAKRIRIDALQMAHISHGSHIGSALSMADIIAVLYNDIMNISPDKIKDDDRDRFILSKGHAGAAVYAALAEKGFFEVEELKTHYSNGSRLSGHISHKVPGIELSTGSLGHGCCVGAGMAIAAKKDGKNHKVYVLMGDGECNEGSVWEMALFANHHCLNNFIIIVDHNKLQSLDTCENTLKLIDLAEKWRVFGWNVVEIDGHNHNQIRNASEHISTEKPTCVIAHTIKGKGVSFMENKVLWHYRDPQGDEYEKALAEIENCENSLAKPYESL